MRVRRSINCASWQNTVQSVEIGENSRLTTRLGTREGPGGRGVFASIDHGRARQIVEAGGVRRRGREGEGKGKSEVGTATKAMAVSESGRRV